jgi:hypothetical protein
VNEAHEERCESSRFMLSPLKVVMSGEIEELRRCLFCRPGAVVPRMTRTSVLLDYF